jgi:hypothetical protein
MEPQEKLESRRGFEDVEAARPVHKWIILLVGISAVICIAAGIVGIIRGATSQSTIHILGMSVSTGSVGVAFAALGIIMLIVVLRAVLKNMLGLAALPRK